jgi:hypothetical protein
MEQSDYTGEFIRVSLLHVVNMPIYAIYNISSVNSPPFPSPTRDLSRADKVASILWTFVNARTLSLLC